MWVLVWCLYCPCARVGAWQCVESCGAVLCGSASLFASPVLTHSSSSCRTSSGQVAGCGAVCGACSVRAPLPVHCTVVRAEVPCFVVVLPSLRASYTALVLIRLCLPGFALLDSALPFSVCTLQYHLSLYSLAAFDGATYPVLYSVWVGPPPWRAFFPAMVVCGCVFPLFILHSFADLWKRTWRCGAWVIIGVGELESSVMPLGLQDGVAGPLSFLFPEVSPPSLTGTECAGKWGVGALLSVRGRATRSYPWWVGVPGQVGGYALLGIPLLDVCVCVGIPVVVNVGHGLLD